MAYDEDDARVEGVGGDDEGGIVLGVYAPQLFGLDPHKSLQYVVFTADDDDVDDNTRGKYHATTHNVATSPSSLSVRCLLDQFTFRVLPLYLTAMELVNGTIDAVRRGLVAHMMNPSLSTKPHADTLAHRTRVDDLSWQLRVAGSTTPLNEAALVPLRSAQSPYSVSVSQRTAVVTLAGNVVHLARSLQVRGFVSLRCGGGGGGGVTKMVPPWRRRADSEQQQQRSAGFNSPAPTVTNKRVPTDADEPLHQDVRRVPAPWASFRTPQRHPTQQKVQQQGTITSNSVQRYVDVYNSDSDEAVASTFERRSDHNPFFSIAVPPLFASDASADVLPSQQRRVAQRHLGGSAPWTHAYASHDTLFAAPPGHVSANSVHGSSGGVADGDSPSGTDDVLNRIRSHFHSATFAMKASNDPAPYLVDDRHVEASGAATGDNDQVDDENVLVDVPPRVASWSPSDVRQRRASFLSHTAARHWHTPPREQHRGRGGSPQRTTRTHPTTSKRYDRVVASLQVETEASRAGTISTLDNVLRVLRAKQAAVDHRLTIERLATPKRVVPPGATAADSRGRAVPFHETLRVSPRAAGSPTGAAVGASPVHRKGAAVLSNIHASSPPPLRQRTSSRGSHRSTANTKQGAVVTPHQDTALAGYAGVCDRFVPEPALPSFCFYCGTSLLKHREKQRLLVASL